MHTDRRSGMKQQQPRKKNKIKSKSTKSAEQKNKNNRYAADKWRARKVANSFKNMRNESETKRNEVKRKQKRK